MALTDRYTYSVGELLADVSATGQSISSTFPFEAKDHYYVGFLTGTVASATSNVVASFEHSPDNSNWYTLLTATVESGVPAALSFEPLSTPRPLLPYGRIKLDMTNDSAAHNRFYNLLARFLVEEDPTS